MLIQYSVLHHWDNDFKEVFDSEIQAEQFLLQLLKAFPGSEDEELYDEFGNCYYLEKSKIAEKGEIQCESCDWIYKEKDYIDGQCVRCERRRNLYEERERLRENFYDFDEDGDYDDDDE